MDLLNESLGPSKAQVSSSACVYALVDSVVQREPTVAANNAIWTAKSTVKPVSSGSKTVQRHVRRCRTSLKPDSHSIIRKFMRVLNYSLLLIRGR